MCAGIPIAAPISWQSVRIYVPSLHATRKRAAACPEPVEAVSRLDSQQRQSVDRHAARLALDGLALACELVEPLPVVAQRPSTSAAFARSVRRTMGALLPSSAGHSAGTADRSTRFAVRVLRRRRTSQHERECVALALVDEQGNQSRGFTDGDRKHSRGLRIERS